MVHEEGFRAVDIRIFPKFLIKMPTLFYGQVLEMYHYTACSQTATPHFTSGGTQGYILVTLENQDNPVKPVRIIREDRMKKKSDLLS